MALLPLLLVVSLAVPSAYSQVTSRPVATLPEVEEITVDVQPARNTPPEPVQVAVPPARTDRITVTRQTAQAERPVEVEPEESVGIEAELEVLRQRKLAQAEIEMTRLAIDRDRLKNEARLEQLQLQEEMKGHAAELTRLRNLVAKGLATSEQLVAREREAVLTEARSNAASFERILQNQALDLRERELTLEREAVLDLRGTALSATTPIQIGDQLRIVIAGEPDFPTTYAVQRGGAVRLPLLGTVNVQGLTVSQAQAAVEKLLASKNITNARVTVSATRR